jgi:hypothetical protein
VIDNELETCRVSQAYVCSSRVNDRLIRILYLYCTPHCNLSHYFFLTSQSTFFLCEDATRPCNVVSFILNIIISFLFIRINLCIMYTTKKDGKKGAECVKYQQAFTYLARKSFFPLQLVTSLISSTSAQGTASSTTLPL